MSYEVTSDDVAGIIEVDASISLTPFIAVASQMVTDICTGYDTAYTDTKLKLIAIWLSAHFYAIRDPRAADEKAGPVAISYQYKVDLNLAVTTYGQQAMAIDTEGGLAALNGRITSGKARVTPSVTWLGVKKWDTDNI